MKGLVVILPVFAIGCGHDIDTARKSVAALAQFNSSAVDTLETFSRLAQENIIAGASTEEEKTRARLALHTFRQKRTEALIVLADFQAVLAASDALFALVERGQKSQADVDTYLQAIFEFMARIRRIFAGLGLEIQGPP